MRGTVLNSEVEFTLRGPRNGRGPRDGVDPGDERNLKWRMPTGSRWYPLYEEDEDFRLWFDNLARGAPSTAINKARVLYRFLNIMEWSLDELTERITGDRDRLEKVLMSFVGQQERLGYAPGTIDNYLKSVKSWAKWNGVELVREIKISDKSSTPTLDDEKVPTVSQVQKIRSAASFRGRICVGGLAYGGLRPEVLGHQHLRDGLRLGDLPELDFGALEFETFPTLVVVRPELSKSKHRYRTFFPEETCVDILSFLERRVSYGEVLTERSPLVSVRPNLRQGQLGYDRDVESRHIRTITVSRDIRGAMRPTYSYRPYVLRGFFSTRLLMAVSDGLLDNNYRVYWMGHKGSMAARYSSNKAELPDDLIESMRAAYSRSRRFLLGDPVNEESMRRNQMLVTARMLGFGEEKLGKLREVLERARTVDEAVEAFQNLRESDVSYKVAASEAEMLERLEEGWTLERDLSGGRFLVKRMKDG